MKDRGSVVTVLEVITERSARDLTFHAGKAEVREAVEVGLVIFVRIQRDGLAHSFGAVVTEATMPADGSKLLFAELMMTRQVCWSVNVAD